MAKSDWGIQSFKDWKETTYVDAHHSSRKVLDGNLFLNGTWTLDGSQDLDGLRNLTDEERTL